jgi:DNA helicase HerA-like ATPase
MVVSAWQALTGLAAWRVMEIPRRALPREQVREPQDEADVLAGQRLAALAAAYHSGTGPVAFAWLRERPGGPVQVLAGGRAFAAGNDGERMLLTLPAGARGEAMPEGGLARELAAMPCWVPIAAIADSLLAQQNGQDPAAPMTVPSLEDGLLAAWPGPFAWLVLADPIGRAELDTLVSAVATGQFSAMRFDDPKRQLMAGRLQARHAELRQGQGSGMWRITLLAGGASERDAAEVAGLVCCSLDLHGLPYALAPEPVCASLGTILGNTGAGGFDVPEDAGQPGPPVRPGSGGQALLPSPVAAPAPGQPLAGADEGIPLPSSPFDGSSRLLAALARPPAREVPGVRFVLRPDFDTTPETASITGAPAVPAGVVLDRNRMAAGQLSVPLASLNRHSGVFGATGAGKSQTVRALLEAATAATIPWLVIEPAKSEYARGMAARLPGATVVRIRPGEADQAAAGINPLEPAPWADGSRFPLQTHADLVKSLFLAAFEADEPFPQVLSAALTRVYEQAGWDLVLGEPATPGIQPGYPALADLQAVADQVVLDVGYGPEVERNVRGFITVRLGSLRLGTPGRFFQGGHPLDFTRLLDTNVVLEIEDVGDDQDKAFLIGTVLIRLTEHLRLRERHTGREPARLRHLTVIEEAHRLLRNPEPGQRGPAAKAVEMFAALFAEVRAYGEGLIVAEQIPAKLLPDVIKNTAVKIVHRLPADDDRRSVGATMNLTEDQSQFLVTLAPGDAAVFTDGMDYPLLARMPDGTAREASTAAETAPPASVIASRSISCGPECCTFACTLRDMRSAARALSDNPGIVLWAEYAVLGHLTGWHMPAPAAPLRRALAALPTRLRDCALSHAVDAAVAARGPVITSRVSPATLAEHVTAAMRAGLDEGRWLCEPQEPRWLAPAYRWAIVLDELSTLHKADGSAGPHPATAQWEHATGRAIPGQSCAAQLRAVRDWYDADTRDRARCQAVAYGTLAPSAIETAIGARPGDPGWDQRLAASLELFTDCTWPLIYLSTTAGQPR